MVGGPRPTTSPSTCARAPRPRGHCSGDHGSAPWRAMSTMRTTTASDLPRKRQHGVAAQAHQWCHHGARGPMRCRSRWALVVRLRIEAAGHADPREYVNGILVARVTGFRSQRAAAAARSPTAAAGILTTTAPSSLIGASGANSPRIIRASMGEEPIHRAKSKPASTSVGNPRALSRRVETARLLHHAAAAERHRHAAHGARVPAHAHGRAHALAPHARRRDAVAAGHGSRRHRHADGGRAPARRRGQAPRAISAAKQFVERVWKWKERIRRHDHAADAPARRLGGLVARPLHDGPGAVARRHRSVRAPARRRPDLPRQAPGQLGSGAAHRASRISKC